LTGRAPVSSSLMMERRGEGGVGEPTQLCKDINYLLLKFRPLGRDLLA
jgi:hypothetical protein